jgi:hypothetical protein
MKKAFKGYSKEEREGFRELEKAFRYYGLAKKLDKKLELAEFAHGHQLFMFLASPSFKRVIINFMDEKKGVKREISKVELVASLVVAIGILFVMYLMVNNI